MVRSTDSAMTYLIDWDTIQIAPRERDLWELAPEALAAYSHATHAPVDHDRLRLYEAWYALAEIAVYTVVFRTPHTGDANDILSWENFLRFLQRAAKRA